MGKTIGKKRCAVFILLLHTGSTNAAARRQSSGPHINGQLNLDSGCRLQAAENLTRLGGTGDLGGLRWLLFLEASDLLLGFEVRWVMSNYRAHFY